MVLVFKFIYNIKYILDLYFRFFFKKFQNFNINYKYFLSYSNIYFE